MAAPGTDGMLKRHLDKIGVGGSIFAALCCLGFGSGIARRESALPRS